MMYLNRKYRAAHFLPLPLPLFVRLFYSMYKAAYSCIGNLYSMYKAAYSCNGNPSQSTVLATTISTYFWDNHCRICRTLHSLDTLSCRHHHHHHYHHHHATYLPECYTGIGQRCKVYWGVYPRQRLTDTMGNLCLCVIIFSIILNEVFIRSILYNTQIVNYIFSYI